MPIRLRHSSACVRSALVNTHLGSGMAASMVASLGAGFMRSYGSTPCACACQSSKSIL